MINISFSDIPINPLSNMELSTLMSAVVRNLIDISGVLTDLAKCLSDEQLKHVSAYDDLAIYAEHINKEI